GRIEGSFIDKAEFTGELEEVEVDVKAVQEWKYEWRGMNEASYAAAAASRWGGWGGDPEPDMPAASDTDEDEGCEEGDELYDSDEEEDVPRLAFC
ncbi:hypothetical protein HDZ31DRAFT_67669, partial [Schizophyllum fasciatum]